MFDPDLNQAPALRLVERPLPDGVTPAMVLAVTAAIRENLTSPGATERSVAVAACVAVLAERGA